MGRHQERYQLIEATHEHRYTAPSNENATIGNQRTFQINNSNTDTHEKGVEDYQDEMCEEALKSFASSLGVEFYLPQ